MRKILPVNTHPYIRSYTHHGYLHSVISSDDKVETDENVSLADFTVKEYSSYCWNSQKGNLTYKENNGSFKVYGNRWNLDMNMTYWRDCKEDDYIEIFIERQMYINPWSSITLFLTDLQSDMLNIDNIYLRVGNFSRDGVYYSIRDDSYSIINRHCISNTIRIEKNNNAVYMMYRDGEDEFKIKITELDHTTNYKIGFSVTLGNNSYYEWLFSNYINICVNYKSGIPIDFICNKKKDWAPHTSDYFIDYNTESLEDIKRLGFNEINYIKKMIDLGRYIEVEVNDNLNDGISDENGAYFHPNLIYGYDDDINTIYLLYYDYGLIKTSMISFDTYLSSRNQKVNKQYIVYKYNPGYEHFKLSAEFFLDKFKEFRDSVYISLNENETGNEHIYGLNCYKSLMSSEGYDAIINDMRISHLLYERSICNRDRVVYLIAKGLLDPEECQKIIEDLNMQCKTLSILKNIILKKQLGGVVDNEQVKNYIESVSNMEIEITEELINVFSCV